MHDRLHRTEEQTTVAYTEMSKENHQNSQSGRLVFRSRFEYKSGALLVLQI
jgi:hypothetical protein